MVYVCGITVLSFLSAFTMRRPTGSLNRSRYIDYNMLMNIVVIVLILFIGLRTQYNDTATYIWEFNNAQTLNELFSDLSNLSWAKNPFFEIYTSCVRGLTDNYHIYFMIPAVFIVISYYRFFIRECDNRTLPYCIFLYMAFGTYFFALSALKQTIAMAILTYAIIELQKKKNLRFVLIVCIAGLFHTYAFLFLIMLFLNCKPWQSWRTYVLILGTIFVFFTFENTLTTILQYADSIGKSISGEGLYGTAGVNSFRVAIYGVTPLMLFFGNRFLEDEMDEKHYVLVHMSLMSFMFMLVGSISGANLFARMARYFELGSIIMLPFSINSIFNERSKKVVNVLMIGLFMIFCLYNFRGFEDEYQRITLFQFLKGIILR